MQTPKLLIRIKDTWSWGRFAWQLAGALGITGLISSVGGSVWAVILGVPLPIALMVGYCTLVGAVYLAMAPLAFRVLAVSPQTATAPVRKKPTPNYTAWRHLNLYELQDAAKLWADVDPNSSGTNDSIAWFEVFRAKIKERELEIEPKYASERKAEMDNPTEFTKIKKDSLKKFAERHGYDRPFYAPLDWRPASPATSP
jgi:hypothetical protein